MIATIRERAALYLRVSSEDQHLDSQRADVLRLCKARNYEIAEVYEEVASTASKDRRA